MLLVGNSHNKNSKRGVIRFMHIFLAPIELLSQVNQDLTAANECIQEAYFRTRQAMASEWQTPAAVVYRERLTQLVAASHQVTENIESIRRQAIAAGNVG
jgi:hypothetical protein